MADKEAKEVFMECGHCGTNVNSKVRAEYTRDEVSEDDEHYVTKWLIIECPSCRKPILQQTYFEWPNPYEDMKILYPVAKTQLSNLPEAVEKEYRTALKYQNSDPNACAVYIGRTLDRLCQHENVKGKRLVEKLRNLISAKNLPAQLGAMADQLRELRNLGAHADEDDEVTAEDAPVMLDFLEAILEYLYVAPAKIAAVQARLNKTP